MVGASASTGHAGREAGRPCYQLPIARAATFLLLLATALVVGVVVGLFSLLALLGGAQASVLAVPVLLVLTLVGAAVARRERCSWTSIAMVVCVAWLAGVGGLYLSAASYSS